MYVTSYVHLLVRYQSQSQCTRQIKSDKLVLLVVSCTPVLSSSIYQTVRRSNVSFATMHLAFIVVQSHGTTIAVIPLRNPLILKTRYVHFGKNTVLVTHHWRSVSCTVASDNSVAQQKLLCYEEMAI